MVNSQGHRVRSLRIFRIVAESTMKSLYHCQYFSTSIDDDVLSIRLRGFAFLRFPLALSKLF